MPKKNSSGEGELIGFKKCYFDLLEKFELDLKDGEPNPAYHFDHVAIIAILRHRIYNYTVCVTNTHLYYLSEMNHIRLNQMSYILDKVHSLFLTFSIAE